MKLDWRIDQNQWIQIKRCECF